MENTTCIIIQTYLSCECFSHTDSLITYKRFDIKYELKTIVAQYETARDIFQSAIVFWLGISFHLSCCIINLVSFV